MIGEVSLFCSVLSLLATAVGSNEAKTLARQRGGKLAPSGPGPGSGRAFNSHRPSGERNSFP